MKLPLFIKFLQGSVMTCTLAMLIDSFAIANGFVPFPFDKVGAMDTHTKLETITGGTLGADVLEHWESAVLVFIGKRTFGSNGVHKYSFNFDGRPATKYALLTKENRMDLNDALTEPSNYGDAGHEFLQDGRDPDKDHAQSIKYDEAWAQDLALEVAGNSTFMRVYLDKTFTRCYFVTCTGERSHDWLVSEEFSKVLRKISKSEVKWIEIPNSLVQQKAESGPRE